MNNLDTKIESYLLGELPEDERIAFEDALRKDTSLQLAVAAHQEMMDRLEAMRLREKVKMALSTAEPTTEKMAPKVLRNIWWVVAAIFLLIAGGFWALRKKTVPPAPQPMAENPSFPSDTSPVAGVPDEITDHSVDGQSPQSPPPLRQKRLLALANSNYQLPPTTVIRSTEGNENSGNDTPAQLAATAFERGNYALAAAILNDDKIKELDEDARFLRANARFKIGQYVDAATDFEALSESFLYKHDARWNYLLCQIALGRVKLAKTLVSRMVADKDSPLHSKAVELQAKLNF